MDSRGNNNELKIEETLGISQHVQQMISNRLIDDQAKALNEYRVNNNLTQLNSNLNDEKSICDSLNQEQADVENSLIPSSRRMANNNEAKRLIMRSLNKADQLKLPEDVAKNAGTAQKSMGASEYNQKKSAGDKMKPTNSTKKLKIRTSDKLTAGAASQKGLNANLT